MGVRGGRATSSIPSLAEAPHQNVLPRCARSGIDDTALPIGMKVFGEGLVRSHQTPRSKSTVEDQDPLSWTRNNSADTVRHQSCTCFLVRLPGVVGR